MTAKLPKKTRKYHEKRKSPRSRVHMHNDAAREAEHEAETIDRDKHRLDEASVAVTIQDELLALRQVAPPKYRNVKRGVDDACKALNSVHGFINLKEWRAEQRELWLNHLAPDRRCPKCSQLCVKSRGWVVLPIKTMRPYKNAPKFDPDILHVAMCLVCWRLHKPKSKKRDKTVTHA